MKALQGARALGVRKASEVPVEGGNYREAPAATAEDRS